MTDTGMPRFPSRHPAAKPIRTGLSLRLAPVTASGFFAGLAAAGLAAIALITFEPVKAETRDLLRAPACMTTIEPSGRMVKLHTERLPQ